MDGETSDLPVVSNPIAFDIQESREAGYIFSFQCPRCYERVDWARSKWWPSTCSCGYEWEVEIIAVVVRQIKP